MTQKPLGTTNEILVTLVPLQANLVAALRPSAEVVKLTDSVTLDASESRDPDRVQVSALQFMQDRVTRSRLFVVVV